MTPELIAIIGTGIALAVVIVPGQRAMRRDIAALQERMTNLERNLLAGMTSLETALQERMTSLERNLLAGMSSLETGLRESMAHLEAELGERMARLERAVEGLVHQQQEGAA